MSNTTSVRALNMRTMADTTLYAGGAHPTVTSGQGVFEYSSIITGIGNQSENIPGQFMLKQNYPNPFNPATLINYILPESNFVTLKVYDINGREVKTLVSDNQSKGSHEVKFDASGLTSGVYFYSLRSGAMNSTKSMLLVK